MRAGGESSRRILQKAPHQNALQAEPRKDRKWNIRRLLKERAATRKAPGQEATKTPKNTTPLPPYSECQINEKNKRKESGSYSRA